MGFIIESGHAPSARITAGWRHDRTVDELIGICRGVLADGVLNKQEASFLQDWLERHREFVDSFPFSVLYPRLRDALADGVMDSEEEHDLLEAIQSTVGGESCDAGGANSLSTELPFDRPCPQIHYAGSGFALTGTFEFGKRREVKYEIESRGGVVGDGVYATTRYVIVGEVGSRDWIHSSFGRKIQHAVELREKHGFVAIIPERHWRESLLVETAL